MTTTQDSAADAMSHALDVLEQHKRCSYSRLIQNARDKEIFAELCNDKIQRAGRGDIQAAKEVLEDFVRSIRQQSKRSWRGPNHFIYARYLAEVFDSILRGADPAIALGIKIRRSGRPRGKVTHNPRALAAAYWLLNRRGIKPERSIRLLTGLTGADRTTVQAARRAPYTAGFKRGLVSDLELKRIVAKQTYGIRLLKLLRSLKEA